MVALFHEKVIAAAVSSHRGGGIHVHPCPQPIPIGVTEFSES